MNCYYRFAFWEKEIDRRSKMSARQDIIFTVSSRDLIASWPARLSDLRPTSKLAFHFLSDAI